MTASITTAPGNQHAIPFGRLVRAEAAKSTDTRAARWLLVGALLAGVVAVVVSLLNRGGLQAFSGYVEPLVEIVSVFVTFVLILLMTSEWSQRTVLTTFLQEPRRARVVAAKACWGVLLALAGGLLSLAIAALGVLLAGALGSETSWDVTVGEAASALLYVALTGIVAMALASLLQHTAGAIVAAFLLPMIVTIVAALSGVPEWLDPGPMYDRVRAGDWSGHLLGTTLLSIAVWVIVPGALGVLRTVRREIR